MRQGPLGASNAGKAKHQSQALVECEERCVVNGADHIINAVAWYGKNLVHHDLRHFAQAVFRCGEDTKAE
jgi:hypothetical protein